MDFNKKHYDTEGPLGIPMRGQFVRLVTAKAPTEVMDSQRADVSWITTKEIDRENEIVVAKGMNDSHLKLNPIVTNNHDNLCPPVGKSLWRKRAKDGPLVGIKARTVYPNRPDAWTGDDWMPDTVLALIQAGMMQGKRVGYLHVKSYAASSHEIAANPDMAQVSRVIDEWLLIEYAVTFLPMNQAALVEAVSKSGLAPERLQPLGIAMPRTDSPTASAIITFTPERELYMAIHRQLGTFDFEAPAKRTVAARIERCQGRFGGLSH